MLVDPHVKSNSCIHCGKESGQKRPGSGSMNIRDVRTFIYIYCIYISIWERN